MKRGFYIFIVSFLLPILAAAQYGPEAELADKYYEDAEFEAALELYSKLHKQFKEEPHFIYRVVGCHDNLMQYDDGIRFLEKLLKKDDRAFDLGILKAGLLERNGKFKEADKIVDEIIYKKLRSGEEFARTGNFLKGVGKGSQALECYLQARSKLKNEYMFIPEVANLHIQMRNYGPATQEFINQYLIDPGYLNGIKIQILNIVDDNSADEIENVLLANVQKNQKDLGVRTIIYEFYIYREAFYEAFIQVKSIDKVFPEKRGSGVFQFAKTMRNNKNFKLSNKAFDYIIGNHRNSAYYLPAYEEKTVNFELETFEAVPIDSAAIRKTVESYADLLNNFGRKATFFEAMYRMSNLMAFYLGDLEGAMRELENTVVLGIRKLDRAKANLLIGDILLMQKKFNKAKLKYNEVEQNFKDEQVGALAKFKQGQLFYYEGDFEFAQARLKSIKDNTTNDISNDALRLNLLIQDNTGLDSTTTALERFAEAQLLVYQHERHAALALLDSILYTFPNHTLTDEIYWEKANIYLAFNDIETSMSLLDKIIAEHGEDILADDALYTKARIYDFNIQDKEKAMEFYLQMLRDFPGSLLSVDVRKRIRELRKEKL